MKIFKSILIFFLSPKTINYLKNIGLYKNQYIYKKKLILYFASSIFTRYFFKKITSNKYDVRMFENIEDYSKKHPELISFIYKKHVDLFYSSPLFDYKLKAKLEKVSDCFSYACILKQAYVIGGSNVILIGKDKAIYDMKFLDKNKKFHYSDQGMLSYNNKFCMLKIVSSDIIYEKAIFLGGNYSWNYYHLTFDILTKFDQIDKNIDDLSIPLLIDKVCFETPQFFQLITILNKNNRKIIPVDHKVSYKVNDLYVFSSPNIIPPNFLTVNEILAEDILFDTKAIEFLRNNLIKKIDQKEFPKKIYISRSQASGRRKFNEDEIFSVLEKYGFKTVSPENYSINEQIAMFNNADFIIGGSGAAFTNILYCKSTCKIIIFCKTKLLFSGFSTIATIIGTEMLYITENSSSVAELTNIHESFNINADELQNIISVWTS